MTLGLGLELELEQFTINCDVAKPKVIGTRPRTLF